MKSRPSSLKARIRHTERAIVSMHMSMELATKEINEKGFFVQTVVHDSHGKASMVERQNPALKRQRESLRSITALQKQLSLLRDELENVKAVKKSGEDSLDFLNE